MMDPFSGIRFAPNWMTVGTPPGRRRTYIQWIKYHFYRRNAMQQQRRGKHDYRRAKNLVDSSIVIQCW